MSETATIAKTSTKPKRTVDEIQRDLDKAKAKHAELHPKVEADNRRGNLVNAQNKRRFEEWQKRFPGEPFDEVVAGFSTSPYQFDDKLQSAFHAVHYEIATLEAERAAAMVDRAKF